VFKRQLCVLRLPLSAALTFFLILLACYSEAQVVSFEQEIQVAGLPQLTAKSVDPSDVLQTSLETILPDRDVCCGKDSALEDSLERSDPSSLKDVSEKLQGRHLLGDGRPIQVTTEYLTPEQVSVGHMMTMLDDKHAALMRWKSHLYVVHGVVYAWIADDQGGRSPVLRKLLLTDTRYSDSRREVFFIPGPDDAGKVQEVLFVEFAPQ
jgi:hypothetical protein